MKKTLVLLTAIIILIFSFSESIYASEVNFTDVSQNNWFYKNLQELAQKDIVGGYPDGTFKPDNNLKFEEFIKMVVVAVADEPIVMVQGQEWYQIYIDVAKKNNYINEDLTKLIGQNIDRNTMADIIYNVLSNKEDFKEYTAEEITYLNGKLTDLTGTDTKTLTISGLGIICGYPDGTFKPNISLRRCETVAIISRLINEEMRLPVEIDLTEIEPTTPTDIEDLPKVDLSHLYTYPTVSGLSVEEENKYYYQYGEDYILTAINDYINYMELTHNRDYTTINKNAAQYKNNLLYYLNGYKEYQGKEYSLLRSDSLRDCENSKLSQIEKYKYREYILSKDNYIENFLDKWIQDTINNKVKVQARFYTNKDLLHDVDGVSAIRGTLRFKYDSHNNPINIKEELDLVQREAQVFGQKLFDAPLDNYNIYLKYAEIPNFKVGKWYEIDMDIVVNNKSYAHGLNEKSDLSYKYIYPIAVREIQ